MSNEKKQDKMKEVFIFVLLSALIVIRFLPIGEDNTFIKSVGYIGVILSILVDTFISKISFPMQPGPEIGSISDA